MATTSTALEDYLERSRFYVGAGSFHESYFVSEIQHNLTGNKGQQHLAWGDYIARFARYSAFWAHYENNVYREIHRWADFYKDAFSLYSFTRSIFSPAYRCIEFWASHILGGALDPDAGDGLTAPSALPIVTDNPAIRPVIAQVWRDSNWQAKKEILTRFGAAMGDAAIMVVDDEGKQKIQFRVVDPRTLRDVVLDCFGNVKAYIIEENRLDPESKVLVGPQAYATYTEVCEKLNGSIRYATFRDGFPYDWREYDDPNAAPTGPEWTEEIDFVPLVIVPHRDMGLGWGWSELQPSLSKLHELDDMASKLHDWVRKTVDAPWLFTGCLPPGAAGLNASLLAQDELQVGSAGEGGKSDTIPTMSIFNPQAKAQHLIAPLDVGAVSNHITKILEEIQNDHPELQADTVGPASSGVARKVAREKVEAMVIQRRAGYDDLQVRANAMGITMGAIKGYPGFQGFDEGSFLRGDLAHSIGPRPVFAVDAEAKTLESMNRGLALKALVDAGLPLETAMEEMGWGQEEIARAMGLKAKAESQALDRIKQRQIVAMADVPPGENGFTVQ